MGIESLLQFLRHPEYREDPNPSFGYRLRHTGGLLVWALALGLVLALLLGLVEHLGSWDLGDHAFEELIAQYPLWLVLVLGVLVAPVLEELIFRGPLWFFRDSSYFGTAFYGATIAFALVHLSNFPNLSEIWLLSPLLISPQLSLGAFLGFVRVRFGLTWAMLFHAAYNGILLGPLLLLIYPDIPSA